MNTQKSRLSRRLCAALLALLLLGSVSVFAAAEGAATVTASALYMRSEASSSSPVVTCLPRGTVVAVTGSEVGWYKVSYNGYSGYMSADYLTLSASASANLGTGTVTGNQVRVRSGASTGSSILAEVNKGTTMTVTGIQDGWYKVSYNGTEGYVSGSYLSLGSSSSTTTSSAASSSSPASGTGTITGNSVRMRSGPSTGNSILGTYNSGTTMTVTGTSGDWYKVSYNGTEGYVYKSYLSLGTDSTPAVTEMTEATYTVTSPVNMRSGPDTSYASQRVLGTGTTVTVTGSSGKWYRVNYNGSTGYIFKTYLTEGEIAATASTTSSSEGEKIVALAKQYLGVSYVYGGSSPSGFDCSGLVYYVFRQCGYSVTRTATTQNRDGSYVARSDLQPGDIIIFYNGSMSAIGHAGIYIGNGQFIHASSSAGKVVITDLSATYYNSHYYSARRIVG